MKSASEAKPTELKGIASGCLMPQIMLENLEDQETNHEDDNEIGADEKQIMEKELASDSTMESDKQIEYVIPREQLASLEMQEAVLANKLCEMYERLMNLDKSSFYRLKDENIFDDENLSQESDLELDL